MKTLITKFLVVALIATYFSSCTSTNRAFQSSPVLSRNVQLDPIKADIEVNETEKLNGEAASSYFLMFRIQGDNTFADGIDYSTDANAPMIDKINPFKAIKAGRLSKVRGAAAYSALSTGDYDVLVHPTYIVTVENYILVKNYKVSVQGYGSKYKNFRTEKQKVVITNNTVEYVFPDE